MYYCEIMNKLEYTKKSNLNSSDFFDNFFLLICDDSTS